MVSYLPAAIFNIGPVFLALSGGWGWEERGREKKVVARFISLPE